MIFMRVRATSMNLIPSLLKKKFGYAAQLSTNYITIIIVPEFCAPIHSQEINIKNGDAAFPLRYHPHS